MAIDNSTNSSDAKLNLTATLMKSSTSRLAGDAVRIQGSPRETLEIFFHRTIRVPDNQHRSALPPGLGTFPLYKVADFRDRLPTAMAEKAGLMLPMYRKTLTLHFIDIFLVDTMSRTRSYVDQIPSQDAIRSQDLRRWR